MNEATLVCTATAKAITETLDSFGELSLPTLCIIMEMMAQKNGMGVLEFYDMLRLAAADVVEMTSDMR
jgi:hypothetical protein